MLVIIMSIFIALLCLFFFLHFFHARAWPPAFMFGILGVVFLVLCGALFFENGRGKAKPELATGRYHVYACARHGKTQHCLLDNLDDEKNIVQYYTFPAAMEEDPDIRDHGTYLPRRIISVWEQNEKKIVFMPTHLIYDWPGDHS